MHDFLKRFTIYGDVWAHLIAWGLRVTPFFLAPLVISIYAGVFLLICGPQRRIVANNLSVILPGSSRRMNAWWRTYLIFWHFAETMVDAARMRCGEGGMDWEIDGVEHFENLAKSSGGVIVMTAHMGNYDIAAPVFAEKFGRKLNTVRAPERLEKTQELMARELANDRSEKYEAHFNTSENFLGVELARLLKDGEAVAIQGDRVLFEVTPAETAVGDAYWRLPKGPFVLAYISRCPIYPLFIMRAGHRRYRIEVGEPFHVTRSRSGREVDIAQGLDHWRDVLLALLKREWRQWFVFEEAFHRSPERPSPPAP